MKEVEFVKQNKIQFLQFFRSKFPIFHYSNIFYRDLRYSLKYYLHANGFRVSDMELETISNALIHEMVSDGILKPVSTATWVLNYPEFHTKTPGKPVH